MTRHERRVGRSCASTSPKEPEPPADPGPPQRLDRVTKAIAVGLGAAALMISTMACSQEAPPVEEDTRVVTPRAEAAVPEKIPAAGDPSTYLLLNQKWVEGLRTETLDLEDVEEVFWHIFSGLPDEVTVYPSENYFYFILYAGGRQIWGNLRLAAGRREREESSRSPTSSTKSRHLSSSPASRSPSFSRTRTACLSRKWTDSPSASGTTGGR